MAVPEDAVAPNIHPAALPPARRRYPWMTANPAAGAQAGTFIPTVIYAVQRIQNLLIVMATVGMTEPYWHWYVDGAWRGVNRSGVFSLYIRDGEQAEILAVPTTDPNWDYIANAPASYPPVRTVWFNESADADTSYYLVQQATGSGTPADGDYSTIDAGKVWHRDGSWQYRAETRRLTDLTWYWFRVVPYDRAGNKGTVIVLSKEYVVRKPDAPTFTSSFAGGTITVS